MPRKRQAAESYDTQPYVKRQDWPFDRILIPLVFTFTTSLLDIFCLHFTGYSCPTSVLIY